jgi:hypothetical protein
MRKGTARDTAFEGHAPSVAPGTRRVNLSQSTACVAGRFAGTVPTGTWGMT